MDAKEREMKEEGKEEKEGRGMMKVKVRNGHKGKGDEGMRR